jgi:2-polyprenyl-6-methoxyphenol hydroxylase-like FAD-dependent oxidoreductase
MDMSSPSDGGRSVLIVGAGPVGLVLACELLQRDVPVRVVDQAVGFSARSRAVLVWPRILELLRRIRVAERMVEAGHRLQGVGYYSEGRLLGTAALHRLTDTPYPFGLTLPQNDTERILRARLAELGGEIERGVSLVDIVRSTPTGMSVLLRHPDGHQETADTGWLVGADGAHSTVRDRLGIAFDGSPVDVTFAITDAPIDGPVRRDLLQYLYSRNGALGVIPLPGGLFRIATNVPAHDSTRPPAREVFQRALDTRAGGLGTVGDPAWTASFQVRTRIAARFRLDRCLLVGDAAHIISPAGGQGMNTGIQDAVAAGWRLASVLDGTAPAEILDEYAERRRAAALRVARTTARQTTWGLYRNRVAIAARDTVFRAAHRAGVVQRVVAPLMAQTDVSYARDQRFGRRGLRPGDRFPLAWPETAADVPTCLARDAATLAVWPGRPATDRRTAARLRAAHPYLHVVDLAALPPAVVDRLAAVLPSGPVTVLIHPDGHVADIVPAEAARPTPPGPSTGGEFGLPGVRADAAVFATVDRDRPPSQGRTEKA